MHLRLVDRYFFGHTFLAHTVSKKVKRIQGIADLTSGYMQGWINLDFQDFGLLQLLSLELPGICTPSASC